MSYFGDTNYVTFNGVVAINIMDNGKFIGKLLEIKNARIISYSADGALAMGMAQMEDREVLVKTFVQYDYDFENKQDVHHVQFSEFQNSVWSAALPVMVIDNAPAGSTTPNLHDNMTIAGIIASSYN